MQREICFRLNKGIITLHGLYARVLLGLAVYFPLEPVVLKFLPGQYRSFVYVLPEAVIWGTFAILILSQVLILGSWPRTHLDKPLLLFTLGVVCTVLVNRAFTFGTLVNVNSLLKYMPIYYIAAHALRNGSNYLPARLTRLILGLAILEMMVGALQLVGVPGIEVFLRPVEVQIGTVERASRLLSNKGREIGAIYGTLGDTIHYAWFLIIALMVSLARLRVVPPKHRGFYWGISIGLIIIFIGFTYSRILILSVVFVLFVAFLFRFRRTHAQLSVLFVGVIALFGGVLLISPFVKNIEYYSSIFMQQSFIQDVLHIYSEQYLQIAYRYNRLGWIVEAPPTVLLNRPFLGFGPDPQLAYVTLYAAQPNFLTFVRNIATMEDTYWVALLIYYGFLGVITWGWILFQHFYVSIRLRNDIFSPMRRYLSWVVLFYVPVMGLALFVHRALEFRIASYFFWLFLGLLQGVYWQRSRRRNL